MDASLEFLLDLETSIELTNQNNSTKPSQKYKPSSMNCIRNMYYQMIGQDIENTSMPTYTNIGILETGTDRHVRIQEAVMQMKNNGYDCEYLDVEEYIKSNNIPNIEIKGKAGVETKLYNSKYNLSFMCDGLIRYKGQVYIIEFKTEGNKYFSSRTGVDTKHYNQATAYSLSFGIEDVLFIYIDRDSLQMKSYILHITDEMRDKIVNKITTCDDYLAKQELPPKEADWTCRWCPYYNACNTADRKTAYSVSF